MSPRDMVGRKQKRPLPVREIRMKIWRWKTCV
jgi:hypothetical protein